MKARGFYPDQPSTRWWRDDKCMVLQEDFSYVTRTGKEHTATKFFRTDGKTVRSYLRGTYLAGPPFQGPGRRAAIIHDWLCQEARERAVKLGKKQGAAYRRYADEVFLDALEFAGAGRIKRKVMWAAVRLGGMVSLGKGHQT